MRNATAIIMMLSILCLSVFAFPPPETILKEQAKIKNIAVGQRVAYWADRFVGTPYDTDPLGEYVRKEAVVADDRVDCMYHVFRSVELASTSSPADAVLKALDTRFPGKGMLEGGNHVLNYEDRFQYGEDMILSGKFGADITNSIGQTVRIKGSRGIEEVEAVPKSGISGILKGLQSGDIIFFVKSPEKRIVGEIIGHMGIVKREGEKVYLIHASGQKKKGGAVKKLLLNEYANSMPFAGIIVTRIKD